MTSQQLKQRMIVAAVLGALGGASLYYTTHAQEKPARETRVWQLAVLDAYSPNGWVQYFAGARIDVVDTEGVCLYLARSRSQNGHEFPLALVAVPKTQLPKGAGCQ